MIKKCSICDNEIDFQYHPETGEVMWREGHNAQPLTNGRCCTECNETKVIPTRLACRDRCNNPSSTVGSSQPMFTRYLPDIISHLTDRP